MPHSFQAKIFSPAPAVSSTREACAEAINRNADIIQAATSAEWTAGTAAERPCEC